METPPMFDFEGALVFQISGRLRVIGANLIQTRRA